MPAKRRKKKNSLHGWLIWFALIVSFCVMGLGLASFQGHLSVSGTVDIGEFSVQFVGTPSLDTEHLVERSVADGSEAEETGFVIDSMSHKVIMKTEETSNSSSSESQNDDNQVSVPELNLGYYDGKSINFNINNAYPGDVYKLHYEVENKGSIPVVLDLYIPETPQLEFGNPAIQELDPGESSSDELTIKVSSAEEGDFIFTIELNFRQRN